MAEDLPPKAVQVSPSAPAGPPEEPTIKATQAELDNGWDDMTLTDYVRERDLAAAEKIDPQSALNQRLRRPVGRAGPRWNFPARRGRRGRRR